MNTCGKCKFFGEPVYELERFDDASRQPIESKYHTCELVKHLAERAEQDTAGPAVCIDGSGYFAALCVREEFGCNRWQPLDQVSGGRE